MQFVYFRPRGPPILKKDKLNEISGYFVLINFCRIIIIAFLCSKTISDKLIPVLFIFVGNHRLDKFELKCQHEACPPAKVAWFKERVAR